MPHDTASRADAILNQILEHNHSYVESKAWHEHLASGKPAKHLAIVTCMDTRLTRLLPDALGLANGDAVFIKVAGATIVDPYGEAMRSLLVAVGELGVDTIMVIGHTNCGTCGMNAHDLLHELNRAGTSQEVINTELAQHPLAEERLMGFSRLEDEVQKSVIAIKMHPLMPAAVQVLGFTIDIETGKLTALL